MILTIVYYHVCMDVTLTTWKKEELFHCGDLFYQDVFDSFRGAKYTLHLEIHFIDDQRLGFLFFKELLSALERGVKIYIVVDGFTHYSKRLVKWMSLIIKKGGQITFFHPTPWRSPCIKGLLGLNKRSHKKVILIDEKIAYLGSFNVDTRQTGPLFGGENWREIGIKIQGEAIKAIQQGFSETWNYCMGNPIKISQRPERNSIIRLNHKKNLRKEYLNDLIQRMHKANSKIWISNPYFVPDFKMLKSLVDAKRRGVDVKILVPLKSDLKLFPYINSIFYRDLVLNGVEVYEYQPSILHAKIMIIDDWMMIGSSNLNSRTQKHDWEIDILLTQDNTKKELLERYTRDIWHSKLVTYNYVIEKFRNMRLYFPFLRAIKYFL